MHELAITEGILDAAVPAAQKHGARKILEIRLKIGELSGVFPEYIREYFSIASAGTIAEGAKLTVETIPVRIRCRTCLCERNISRKRICCPECGGTDLELISGREYFVDSLEVE